MDEIILKADNKSSAIKEIAAIFPGAPDLKALEKASISSVRESALHSPGYPCRYSLINNEEEKFTIEIDYTPKDSYDESENPDARLIVHYYPNFRILGDNTDFSEFEDYDEAHLEKGKWKLPSDWHKLIIDSALSEIFPETKDRFEAECARKKSEQFTNSSFKLKPFLGVSNRGRGRNG